MKKILILLFLLCTTTPSLAANTICLANGEFPPFMSKQLKNYGVISHIVSEVFAVAGVQVNYKFYPWKRGYQIAIDGDCNGTTMWSYSEGRAKDFYYSDPIFDGNTVFFYLISRNFEWDTLQDLALFKIGATIGYSYGDEFDRLEKIGHLNVSRVSRDEQNILMLLNGRVEIVPIEKEVGYGLLQKHLTSKQRELITHHKKPMKTIPYHLILSKSIKENERLIQRFNAALKEFKASGKYEQLMLNSREGKYEPTSN